MSAELDAVVVGSGPNGLSAAIVLAEAGRSVRVLEAAPTPGGGTRTDELTLPGFRHDVCSAIHPLAAAGPFFADHGVHVDWAHPEVLAAHPLDDGTAGVLLRGVEETAAANDAPRWATLFSGPVAHWDRFAAAALRSPLSLPTDPVTLAGAGLRAALPASVTARVLGTPQAGALFAGIAAHVNGFLGAPLSSSAGVGLAVAGHVGGWPCARGGSSAIAQALVSRLEELGGEVVCGRPVRSTVDLPAARATLFDLTPWQVARILGDQLPRRVRRRWARFRPGPGTFKVDYALDGPVPWTNEQVRRAGTVHLGGTWREVAAAEAEVRRGRLPTHPFVLVAQQSLFDPTRAPEGRHTLWAYCHVPRGCRVDMTERIESQIDRFAPGWRDLVLDRAVTTPAGFAAYNQNYLGGSIDGGAGDLLQVVLRPDATFDPYRVGGTAMWLCSSSTPPGGGVHGLCGLHAARSVLRSLDGG